MSQLEVETKFSALSSMSLQCKLFNILIQPYCLCYQVLFCLNYRWAKKVFSFHWICMFDLATSEVCKERCFNSSVFCLCKMSPSPSINRSITLDFLLLLLCLNYVSYLAISQGCFIFNISYIPLSFYIYINIFPLLFLFPISCLRSTLKPAKLLTKVIFDFEFGLVFVVLFCFKYSINLKYKEISKINYK